jgi:hypothetical protein
MRLLIDLVVIGKFRVIGNTQTARMYRSEAVL